MNGLLIKKMREERAWSQEHLAAASGLSLRTIQRVEAEGRASAETRLALAAALGVEVSCLSGKNGSCPQVGPEASVWRISWQQYRWLRYGLIAVLLMGADIYRHGRPTWSGWMILIGALVLGLRWLRCRFVEPKSSD